MDHRFRNSRMFRLHKVQRLFKDLFGHDILIIQLMINKADVDIVIVEQLIELGRLMRAYVQRNLFIRDHDLPVERREQRSVQTVRAANGDGHLVRGKTQALGLLPQSQKPFRYRDKIRTFRSQVNLLKAFFPDDQRKMKFLLERPKAMTDRRLGEKQKIRRPGNTSGRDNGEKSFNFSQIHDKNPFYSALTNVMSSSA